jgi:hypothetical protein
LLNDLELFTINAISQENELQSLLFVGTNFDEKQLKKKKKVFSGYQILGHIIPESIQSEKHFEDFDMRFVYNLIRSPQKYKKIEIMTTSEDIPISFEPLFSKK